MRRLARVRSSDGSAVVEEVVPAAPSERAAQGFVAAVSGLSALVDSAWLVPDRRPAT